MPSRFFILDSHGQLYASFYAIRDLTSPQGEPTNATFGFLSTLLKILRQERPDYLAACFDMPGLTHRHELFQEYKAQRPPMPPELVVQVERVRQILGLMGIPAVGSAGYEADDCIATLSRRAREAGMEVVICSRDKDLEQLVGPGVAMLDTKTFEHLDAEGILKRRGVPPAQTIDVLALMGDATDNIPGVPGIGEKTAVKLIAQYGNVENVLSHAAEVKGKVGDSLRAHMEDARQSRVLVQLDAAVPLKVNLEDCRAHPAADPARLAALFRKLGFNRFIEELTLDAGATGGGAIRTHIVETRAALARLAKDLAAQPAFAFDTETTGLDPRKAALVGLSFAWADDEGYYVPLRGPEGSKCLSLDEVKAAIGPWLAASPKASAASTRLLVGQNVKYDLLVCRRAGIELAEPLFDTMVAAYLASPGRREYNLDALALAYFGFKKIPLESLLGQKGDERTMDACPIAQVAAYSVEDAVITWRLRGVLEKELAEKGLADLAREVEMPLVPVLAAMEETGVAVDPAVLADIAANLQGRLEKLEKQIYAAAGREFSIHSPQQLAGILFEELGLKPLKRTAKGLRSSTDADVLEELAARHPLPRLILEFRQLAKLKGTYVDALPQLVDPEDGRIHASFNQTVTATGRLSSSDPNLQNIPIRTDEGRQVRRAFVPGRAGWLLLAADYSQIELRMLAHYSGDAELGRAFAEDRDIHTFVAAQIYGVAETDVTGEMRRVAKVVNFSLIYGKTAYGLARDLSIGVGEAERFIDDYFHRYRGVREFTAKVLTDAKRDGYVTTILGRRREIGEIGAMDPKRLTFAERTAVNTVIQGSAADLMKVAMNRIWRRAGREGRPSRPLIQIHDELIFETPADALAEEEKWITEEMVGAMALRVPLRIHLAVGRNWMEAE